MAIRFVFATFVQISVVLNEVDNLDQLQKGRVFRVASWNVDSLTDSTGEVEKFLGDRKVDVVYCVQETRWIGLYCGFFDAVGKKYKLLMRMLGENHETL